MLPVYSVTILKQSATQAVVEVHQLNSDYKFESKSIDGVTLIVGDSDNNLLLINDNL